MNRNVYFKFPIVVLSFFISNTSLAATPPSEVPSCDYTGPQAPRDIDSRKGKNRQVFSMAKKHEKLNLCNIHFHNSAEHKAEDFSIEVVGNGEGHGDGYACGISTELNEEELARPTRDICHGLMPGETIEVHWVHTSCQVAPGAGLGSCSSPTCANPELRVETQVFTLVNDSTALDFNEFDLAEDKVNGRYQAKMLPYNTGTPVQFLGSTTGTSYDNVNTCSPLQVTWSVRPRCAKLDINSLAKWCEGNVFSEDHAHGVRKLVTDPKLLSRIRRKDH